MLHLFIQKHLNKLMQSKKEWMEYVIDEIKHNDISMCIIANFLNENKILRRNKKWTEDTINIIILESKKN